METNNQTKKIVSYLIEHKILVSDTFIQTLQDPSQVKKILEKIEDPNFKIQSEQDLLILEPTNQESVHHALFNPLEVVFNYKDTPKKREFQDFVSFFNARYQSLSKLLQQRQDLQFLTSISRVLEKRDKDQLSIIAMVTNKENTKNGNIMLTVEDPTGMIKVLVNKSKQEVYDQAKDLVLDEVIGIVGGNGDNILFANKIIWPDVPFTKELKKGPEELYAVFLSDIHVGSKYFLEEELQQFMDWVNGNIGNDAQKSIAKKIGYVFVIGDLVDGVGIYPGQEKELILLDVKKQYEEFARIFSQIPKHIKLIMCPGNHDAMRLAEPQLELYTEFSQPIWDLPNSVMVTNPAVVNIGKSGGFPGFDVLIYHGYSFDYYAANVESIRTQGGAQRADLIMKFLLQRRHLAPTHTSTLYIADANKDSLVIQDVPDIFAAGHLHKSQISSYRNVAIIAGSCWQAKTSFQEKIGHTPDPCRVPVLNLKTREITMMSFSKEDGN